MRRFCGSAVTFAMHDEAENFVPHRGNGIDEIPKGFEGAMCRGVLELVVALDGANAMKSVGEV